MAKERFTVMFSCIGRRVALVSAFRHAMGQLGLEGRILGADSSPYSSAARLCDEVYYVHLSSHAGYVENLLEICGKQKVDILIPLIDPELQILAGQNARFAEVGTTLLLSAEGTIDICRDKVKTYKALVAAGIDTPRVFTYRESARADLPLFMKPRGGSSARDIHKINTLDELVYYHRQVPNAIIQEYIDGQEFTLDVFADFEGRALCVVPRRRIEVRAGEVSKSVTCRDAELIRLGTDTVQALKGCMGPVTIQCFRTASGRTTVIEINPRLGGGVPLSIEAGADIPRWTIQCALGQTPDVDPDAWRDRLVMLRYDDAFYISEDMLP